MGSAQVITNARSGPANRLQSLVTHQHSVFIVFQADKSIAAGK